MPASEARILANQRNAQLSTGPKTAEGKEQSRRNALKHGLTGAGVVLLEADAAEVERRSAAYARELKATGEVGLALARRAALNAVRMERGADQQAAALAEHVRRAEAEFVAPEGVTAEEAARLRPEAARRAMFDPSKEATLARKYELAAERGFYRALKELRQAERDRKPPEPVAKGPSIEEIMASIAEFKRQDAASDAMYAEMGMPLPPVPRNYPNFTPAMFGGDVPTTIGRRG